MRRMILCLCLGFLMDQARTQNRFDVLVTEVFADPSPTVGLPNYEWIEIKNVSLSPISLSGWRLADEGGQSGAFPNYILAADSSLVICSSSALPLLSAFGASISVTSFPSLDNDGELLSLRSNTGRIIHAVRYELSWYKNDLKQLGGWSLEMIDTRIPCAGKQNWKASEDARGGSPGRQNSVQALLQDTEAPVLLRSFARNSITLRLLFSEPVDSASAALLTNYSISGNTALQSIILIPPLFSEAEIRLSAPVMPDEILTLTAVNVKDCHGNMMSSSKIKTGLASLPAPGDWIINEIMFDPRPNGYDYVEFYNNSERILDLSALYIGNRNSSGAVSGLTALHPSPRLLFPKQYVVVTPDPERLSLHYHVKDPSAIIGLGDLPSFPDDAGTVVTVTGQGSVTDELIYDKEWHFKLLSDPEGVSLERIDAGSPTQNPMNWHSASAPAGYGTPGYENSQYRSPEFSGKLYLDPPVFSPDNDGRDDVLMINYELPSTGYQGSIRIFDYSGTLVRSLMQDRLAGRKGSWTWDGLSNKGTKLPLGIYIIAAEFFNLEGRIEKMRLPVVIAKPY